MRKGLTREPQRDEPATRGKNYITPSGLQRLKDEHGFLLTRDRPAVAEVVAWAASNGDRGYLATFQPQSRSRLVTVGDQRRSSFARPQ
jgi:transcription elongation factor GreB